MEAQTENKRLCCKLEDLADSMFWPAQVIGAAGGLAATLMDEAGNNGSDLYQLADGAFNFGLLGFAATLALYASSSVAGLFYKKH